MSNWKKAKECEETVKCVSIALCFILQDCCFHTPQRTKLCCGFLWALLKTLTALCLLYSVCVSTELFLLLNLKDRNHFFLLLSVIDSVSVWVNVRAQVYQCLFVYTCYLSYVYNLLPSCPFKARIPNLGNKAKPGQSWSVASKQQPSQLSVITWEACQSRQTHTNMPLFKA